MTGGGGGQHQEIADCKSITPYKSGRFSLIQFIAVINLLKPRGSVLRVTGFNDSRIM